MGDPDGFDYCIWPGSGLAVEPIWEMNKWIEDFSLVSSHFYSKLMLKQKQCVCAFFFSRKMHSKFWLVSIFNFLSLNILKNKFPNQLKLILDNISVSKRNSFLSLDNKNLHKRKSNLYEKCSLIKTVSIQKLLANTTYLYMKNRVTITLNI